MHDPLLVRRLERPGDLTGDLEALVDRHRPAGDPLGERVALDELEHERLDPSRLLEAVDRGDVGVVERREHLRLAPESGQPLGILRHRLGKDLDRDVAVEFGVPRPVHLPHPARSERRDDLVGAEPRSSGEGHVRPKRTTA